MAKKKQVEREPTPEEMVAAMVADLKAFPPTYEIRPWHRVKYANHATVVKAALDSGQVELTEEGGMRLVKDQSED